MDYSDDKKLNAVLLISAIHGPSIGTMNRRTNCVEPGLCHVTCTCINQCDCHTLILLGE